MWTSWWGRSSPQCFPTGDPPGYCSEAPVHVQLPPPLWLHLLTPITPSFCGRKCNTYKMFNTIICFSGCTCQCNTNVATTAHPPVRESVTILFLLFINSVAEGFSYTPYNTTTRLAGLLSYHAKSLWLAPCT